jgi:endonuclease/exonuclease/phosphatase family metal-dependent hydrolase
VCLGVRSWVCSPLVRVATLNLWGRSGAWMDRRAVLVDGFARLRPDVVGLQEVIHTDDYDQAADVLGEDFEIAHQTLGLLGDGNSAAIASRFPIAALHEVDLQLPPRTSDFPAITLIAELDAPAPVGPLLFVNHLPSWKPELEREREVQTVKAARAVQELAGDRAVVLAGDLDATPDAASIRFLRGRQSLEGTSVHYVDAWAQAHPDDPGLTFTPRNPLVMQESSVTIEEPRRIDYIFIRGGEGGPALRVDACERIFDEPVNGVWASDHFGLLADLAPFS